MTQGAPSLVSSPKTLGRQLPVGGPSLGQNSPFTLHADGSRSVEAPGAGHGRSPRPAQGCPIAQRAGPRQLGGGMATILPFPQRRPLPRSPRMIAQDSDYFRHARQQVRTAMLGVLVCAIVSVLCSAMAYAFISVAYLANSVVFLTLSVIAAVIGGCFAHWGKREYDEYHSLRSRYRDRRSCAQRAPAFPDRRHY